MSRQSFLRNLDVPTEYLTPSDFGLELAFGIGKPIDPSYGNLTANIVSYDYLDGNSSDSKGKR